MFMSPREPLSREQTRYLRKLVGREMELSEDASFVSLFLLLAVRRAFANVGAGMRRPVQGFR